jgi:hypothetical protein
MNSSVDSSYIGGYDIPIRAIFPYCPNVRSHVMESRSEPLKNVEYSKKEKSHMRVIKTLQDYVRAHGNGPFKPRHYGLPCQNASTLVHPNSFKTKVVSYITPQYTFENGLKPLNRLEILVQRSLLWYSAFPWLNYNWWNMYMEKSADNEDKEDGESVDK